MKLFLAIYLISFSQAFAMGSLHVFPGGPSTLETVPDAGDMEGSVSVLNQLTPEENLQSQQDREEEMPKEKEEKNDQKTYPVEQRSIHE